MSCGFEGEYCHEEDLEQEIVRLEAEVKQWRDAEHALSRAYLRLRKMIPGAFDTPTAPTGEQVWAITEQALRSTLTAARKRLPREQPTVVPRSVPGPDAR